MVAGAAFGEGAWAVVTVCFGRVWIGWSGCFFSFVGFFGLLRPGELVCCVGGGGIPERTIRMFDILLPND